jgi:N-acetylglutamate synthase-like GNAT family acetyltransferase
MSDHLAVKIRPARRQDVKEIVAMLADDALGSTRERVEDPLPESYFRGFEAIEQNPHIHLAVAEDADGAVVGCLQLCILPGLSAQGSSVGLIESVRVASHCRSHGVGEQIVRWAISQARAEGCGSVELLTHNTRVHAQRFYARLGFSPTHVGMKMHF